MKTPRTLPLLLLAGMLLASVLVAVEPAAEPAPAPTDPTAETATDKVEALRRENELLRKENQALRRQVVALRTRLGSAAAESAAKDAKTDGRETDEKAKAVKPDMENDEHWLSGSGRRHNSSCRYFKTGNGRLCTEKEGSPCKVCGG